MLICVSLHQVILLNKSRLLVTLDKWQFIQLFGIDIPAIFPLTGDQSRNTDTLKQQSNVLTGQVGMPLINLR